MHDSPLPTQQHRYEGLPELPIATLHERRERVFLVLAGLFLGTLAMLNILGITRFLNVAFFIKGSERWDHPLAIAVGVLPYPLTFLCTDFISELYGRKRANFVVFVGLLLNLWVVLVLWLGGAWPGFPTDTPLGNEAVFFDVRAFAFKAVTASMIAYLAAQFIDVQVFHFWKRVTNGRRLWLRNNGSTLVSQLVDTIAVILITFGSAWRAGTMTTGAILALIATGYVFKAVIALLDTIPFYLGAIWLTRWLRLPPPTLTEGVPGGAAVEAGVG
ncbi:MAG: queuosine precursor transporter [Phycisphaeraceae bacterium]|nr:queuosine precursor transporter [Phycisphaeraceae bacterium]MCB9847340.1 queuosine precursor transporter [Phycisphaeraceae bacterium]